MKKLLNLILLVILTLFVYACNISQSSTYSTVDTSTSLTSINTTNQMTSSESTTNTLTSINTTNEMTSSESTTNTLTSQTTESSEAFVDSLIESMSLRQKAAQMVQAERSSITYQDMQVHGIGSVLSGGGSHPNGYDSSIEEWYDMVYHYQEAALNSEAGVPMLYGIDAVHGHNNLYGATIFPHNINLGMANDADLVYRISQATAKEMLSTGIHWNFAPALSVVQNISWGRTYEGYSENPLIHKNLTRSAIKGYQDLNVLATAKHYLGDGGTYLGIDQGNMIATESVIRSLHLEPFIEAVNASVDTIMISYSSINGIKMHSSSYWINDVLKEELGFMGFVISDWNAIHQLSGDFYNQVVTAINSGIDMLMQPYDWLNTIDMIVLGVEEERIALSRVDDAVRRILTIKHKRGLFSDPYRRLDDLVVYSNEHKSLAREAVRKSLVLLKNDNAALPLNKEGNIFIGGPASNSVGLLCGGWTTYWQGNENNSIGVGRSIKASMLSVLANNGGSLKTNWQNSDVVVIVLSELPYAEGVGDNSVLTLTGGNAHPGNLAALALARDAKASGKTVIGVLISGRPLLLEDNLDYFDAFVAAFLPGSEGGDGISDLLFGDYNFSGKLAFTWPKDISQVGYNSNLDSYNEAIVMYPYQFGLKYES